MVSFNERSVADQVRELTRKPGFADSFFVTAWKTRAGWWNNDITWDPIQVLQEFDRESILFKRYSRRHTWSDRILVGYAFTILLSLFLINPAASLRKPALVFVGVSCIFAFSCVVISLQSVLRQSVHKKNMEALENKLQEFLQWLNTMATMLMLGETMLTPEEQLGVAFTLSEAHLKAVADTAVKNTVEQASLREQAVRMLDPKRVDIKVLATVTRAAVSVDEEAQQRYTRLKILGLIDGKYSSFWQAVRDKAEHAAKRAAPSTDQPE
jgi:hypothetical protein